MEQIDALRFPTKTSDLNKRKTQSKNENEIRSKNVKDMGFIYNLLCVQKFQNALLVGALERLTVWINTLLLHNINLPPVFPILCLFVGFPVILLVFVLFWVLDLPEVL